MATSPTVTSDPKPAPVDKTPSPYPAPLTPTPGTLIPVEPPPPYVWPPLKVMQMRLAELMIKYGFNSDPVKNYKLEILHHPDSKAPAPVVPAKPK